MLLGLQGLITDDDLASVEEAFPGICRYYLELKEKPCTFLELLWSFARRGRSDSAPLSQRSAGSR